MHAKKWRELLLGLFHRMEPESNGFVDDLALRTTIPETLAQLRGCRVVNGKIGGNPVIGLHDIYENGLRPTVGSMRLDQRIERRLHDPADVDMARKSQCGLKLPLHSTSHSGHRRTVDSVRSGRSLSPSNVVLKRLPRDVRMHRPFVNCFLAHDRPRHTGEYGLFP